MNSRPTLSLLAALAAAATALACSASCGGARELKQAETASLVSAPAQLLAPGEQPDGEAPRAFTPLIAPGEGLRMINWSISEAGGRKAYEVNFAFPLLKGRLGPAAEKYNRAVSSLARRAVTEFKSVYADAPRAREGGGDSLDANYDTVLLTDDFVSVRFNTYALVGGGRDLRRHLVINFDLKAGRVVEFGELFAPGSAPLEAVASYCAAELKRRDAEARARERERLRQLGTLNAAAPAAPADDLIEGGAAPEAENYRAWNVTAEGLLVSFAPCQVDACSEGEKEVLVPYSALAAILNPDGPAARLAARRTR